MKDIIDVNVKDNKTFIYFPESPSDNLIYTFASLNLNNVHLVYIPEISMNSNRINEIETYFKENYNLTLITSKSEYTEAVNDKKNVIFDTSYLLNQIEDENGTNWKSYKNINSLKIMMNTITEITSKADTSLIYYTNSDSIFNAYIPMRRVYALFNKVIVTQSQSMFKDIIFRVYEGNKLKSILVEKKDINNYLRKIKPSGNIQNSTVAANIVEKSIDDIGIDIDEDVKKAMMNSIQNSIEINETKYNAIDDINDTLDINNSNLFVIRNALYDINPNTVLKKQDISVNDTLLNKTLSVKDLESTIKSRIKIPANKIDKDSIKNINANFGQIKTIDDSDISSVVGKKIYQNEFKAAAESVAEFNIQEFKEKSYHDIINNYTKDIINKHKDDDVSISLENMKIIDTPINESEFHINVSKTYTVEMDIKLNDDKKQKIKFDIPKLENGYFVINGKKKLLVSQLLIPPIYFNKPHNCIIQTIFGLMRTNYVIKNKRMQARVMYAGKVITYPLAIIFYKGFHEAMNYMFGMNKWTMDTKSDPRWKNELEIDGGFIRILNNNLSFEEKILFQSFDMKIWKLFNIEELKKDQEKYIAKVLDDERILNLTKIVFSKIIDPVNASVLKQMNYPTEIIDLLINLLPKLESGFVQTRNDLNLLRLRNSEVLYQIINKSLEKAYTEYRMKVITKKKDPKFEMNKNEVIKNFVTNSLVTSAEYSNLVEDVSNRFKVSFTGNETGGLKKQAVGLDVRDISETYFGVIDPIETGTGASIGILQHLVPTAIVRDSRGSIKTFDKDDSNNKILGTTTSLLPFVNFNDSTRVMMAANQIKQSVQLLNADEPIVRTGGESNLKTFASDAFIKRSPAAGVVKRVIPNKSIIIIDRLKKQYNIPVYPMNLHSGGGLAGYQEFNIIVREGQVVKPNQIVAESKYSFGESGSVKYGKNLLTAFMPWKGYNFEDGVVISEKIVNDYEMVSPRTFELEVLISPEECPYVSDINITTGKDYSRSDTILKFTPKSLKGLAEYIENAKIESGKVSINPPNGTLFDIDGYLVDTPNPSAELLRFIKRNRITVVNREKIYYNGERVYGLLLILRFKTFINIGFGDKVSNRHGNKGVICKIEKEENMPMTPWGERVELIMSPIGIAKRNNFGQVLELYLGLAASSLIRSIKEGMPKSKFIKLVSEIYKIIDNSPKKAVYEDMKATLSKLSDKDYKQLPDIFPKGFPLLVKPLHGPSPYDLEKLLKLMKLKNGYKLYLPEFNMDTVKPVPVGRIYTAMLEHLASKKITGRGIGKRSTRIGQPVKEKEYGANRLGEFDSWSLLSHSADRLLSEIWNINSDNIPAKNYAVNAIISRGDVSLGEIQYDTANATIKNYITALFLSIGLKID